MDVTIYIQEVDRRFSFLFTRFDLTDVVKVRSILNSQDGSEKVSEILIPLSAGQGVQEVEETRGIPNTVARFGPQPLCMRSIRWDIYCSFSIKKSTVCALLERANESFSSLTKFGRDQKLCNAFRLLHTQ